MQNRLYVILQVMFTGISEKGDTHHDRGTFL